MKKELQNVTHKVLRRHTSEIMKLWHTEVTKQVFAAKEANIIAVYDHLPNIIKDVADIFEREIGRDELEQDTRYLQILENSENHGKHRSITPHYTVDQVVHEYIIFHRTISSFLKSKDCYSVEVSDLLKYIIETSILKSVGAFSRSIQEMQEKLIGTLAHDIRNPLSISSLSLDMYADEEEQEWKDNMVVTARKSLKKAIGLIEGLMDGITVKAGEGMMMNFEEINIISDVKNVVEEVKEAYDHEFILNLEDAEINGIFDSSAIRRLLDNLISNAVKYGSSDTPITITVVNKGDAVELSVHNLGEPISEDEQKKIFEFLHCDKEKTKSSKSWGMGLTLAQIVAKAHGGEIKLFSDLETGTTFKFLILKNFNEVGSRRTKLDLS